MLIRRFPPRRPSDRPTLARRHGCRSRVRLSRLIHEDFSVALLRSSSLSPLQPLHWSRISARSAGASPEAGAEKFRKVAKSRIISAMNTQHLAFGHFEFIAENGCLFRDNRPVAIGARGASLLAALLSAQGGVVSKSALMDAVWPGLVVEESNLSVQIAALRKLLGPASDGSEWIVTVPRVGYRFSGPVESRTDAADSGWHAQTSSMPAIAVLPFEISAVMLKNSIWPTVSPTT